MFTVLISRTSINTGTTNTQFRVKYITINSNILSTSIIGDNYTRNYLLSYWKKKQKGFKLSMHKTRNIHNNNNYVPIQVI